MTTEILIADSVHNLNHKIQEEELKGWKTIGSHQVVVIHSQLRYAGTQHKDTVNQLEYSITMVKGS
jgi:hypothetical protein